MAGRSGALRAGGPVCVIAAILLAGGVAYLASPSTGSGSARLTEIRGTLATDVTTGVPFTVLATVPVGQLPTAVAFDAVNGVVYVADAQSNAVTAIRASTNSVLTTIPVGTDPTNLVVDPDSGDVYVANYDSSDLSVIDPSTNVVATTITVGSNPTAMAYDAANQDLYVTNWGGNAGDTVSVVATGTQAVIGTLTVGPGPNYVAVDSANGDIYVANTGPPQPESETVSVISGSTNAVLTTIAVGAGPAAVSYDPTDGIVFVDDYDVPGRVSAISGATNAVVATVPSENAEYGPNANCVDPASDRAFISYGPLASVQVINGSTYGVDATIAAGSGVGPMGYDPVDGLVYALNGGSSNVTIINGSTDHVAGTVPVGSYPFSVAFNPNSSVAYVANERSNNVSVIGPRGALSPEYPVTFTETGLPTGSTWWVNFTDGWRADSTSASIVLPEPNGSYDFSVQGSDGYSAAPAAGTVNVAGATANVAVSFSHSNPPPWWEVHYFGVPLWVLLLLIVILLVIVGIVRMGTQRRPGPQSGPGTPPTSP
jgi:YVTN family beta-propeller protein